MAQGDIVAKSSGFYNAEERNRLTFEASRMEDGRRFGLFLDWLGSSDQTKEALISLLDWKVVLKIELDLDNKKDIFQLANNHFIENGNLSTWKPNMEAIREFEVFAECTVIPVQKDSLGWCSGGLILYSNKIFSYG